MEYSAARLHELSQVLKQAVLVAPAHLKKPGQNLMDAITQVTRLGDLMGPIVGPSIIEQLVSAYFIPQIHNYVKQVQGQPKTPALILLMPSLAIGAQASDILGTAGRLFGGMAK